MTEYQIPPNSRSYELKEGTESQESDETHEHRNGEFNETHETQDSASVACVSTLQQAVRIALKSRINKHSILLYRRVLMAMEITVGVRFKDEEIESLFHQWWVAAQNKLPTNADYTLYLAKFAYCFHKAKVPLGVNPIESAIEHCDEVEPAEELGPVIGRLAIACQHIQGISRKNDFFISVRDAARIIKTKDMFDAAAALNELRRKGYIVLVEEGRGRKAARYRFIH